jgi:hypothetical protein
MCAGSATVKIGVVIACMTMLKTQNKLNPERYHQDSGGMGERPNTFDCQR